MRSMLSNHLLLWSVRDLFRRPVDTLLVFFSMASLATIVGTALLLTHAVNATARKALTTAPDLVVRRLHPAGWAPIPQLEATHQAMAVTGVVKATPRIWGVVNGPETPVTVIGVSRLEHRSWLSGIELPPPRYNEAIVGPGVVPL